MRKAYGTLQNVMIESESNMSSEYIGSIRNIRSVRRRYVPGPLWDVLTLANEYVPWCRYVDCGRERNVDLREFIYIQPQPVAIFIIHTPA